MAESQLARGPTLAAPQGAAGERLAPGAAAGDYVVDGFLGAGAMGEVYAGRHPVIGKRVAIKVLKRELASSAEAAERFVREARAVNQVNHPNVIDVFGFGRLGDGRLYLVMDLVEGRSLRKAVQDNLLDVPATLDVLAQIAGALDAAHARGVVHRDLKPDNVMIDDATPAKVYVLDFGIAKLVTEGGALGNGTLTGQGAWLGTPGYMAPEQWSADGAGPASDRYALGVMAFELLSGKLPFQAQSLPQMMEQHFRAPVPALTARGAAPSNATFDPVLSRAMAKDPGQRYATAAELVEALRAAAGTRPKRSIAAFPRRMWIPAAAGAGVLGLAVVAVIAARDGGGASADPANRPRASSTPPPPAGGLARVDVLTRPAGATVKRDGRLLGATPASFDVRIGDRVELEIGKPGYATIHRVLDAAPAVGPAIDVALEPQNGFEGVWALPDGQLRAFARAGEDVHVFKLAMVNGEREFYRKLALEDAPAGEVMLVATETMADARSAHDASCQISHRIEYHYQTATDALDVRPENIETAVRDGRCIVVRKEPGKPMLLVRADRGPGDTRWSHAPVGVPQKNTRLPSDTFDNPADVNQKTIPIDDQAVQQKRDAAAKKAKLAPAPKNAPKSVLTNAPNNAVTSAKDPPPPPPNADNSPGEVQNQAVPNAPLQAPPQQTPQQAPQPQAPQPQAPQQVLPRGDSQVAPQVQGQDTGTQQQRPVKPSRKK